MPHRRVSLSSNVNNLADVRIDGDLPTQVQAGISTDAKSKVSSASLTMDSKRLLRRGVIGVLSDGQRLLTIRRAAGVVKGGYWCFPGGHVEPGESPRRAVRREFTEELGIDVVTTRLLGSIQLTDSPYLLDVWRVRHAGGEIRPNPQEVAEAIWLHPDQIRRLPLGLPSNSEVLRMLGV